MPVHAGNNEWELSSPRINNIDDLVSGTHSKSSARTEVVLEIDDDESLLTISIHHIESFPW